MPPKPRPDLPAPPDNLRQLADHERKIRGGPVFELAEVQAYIADMGTEVLNLATRSASEPLLKELAWTSTDLANFIKSLAARHYRGSEWCYGSANATVPYPSDIYIMGFSRLRAVEWPQQNPQNYLKFSVSVKHGSVEIFSIHPEDY